MNTKCYRISTNHKQYKNHVTLSLLITNTIQITWPSLYQSQTLYKSRDPISTNHKHYTNHVTLSLPITNTIQITWPSLYQSQTLYKSRDPISTNHKHYTNHVTLSLPIRSRVRISWRSVSSPQCGTTRQETSWSLCAGFSVKTTQTVSCLNMSTEKTVSG